MKKQRFPAYSTLIGEDTEVAGGIRFLGALHVDGKVSGDIQGLSDDGCALTLGQSGTIEGSLDVAHVVLDGRVIGDVRATHRAELASGARIEGTIYYGVLEMAEGAEVNGKLLHIDDDQKLQLAYGGTGDRETAGIAQSASEAPAGDGKKLHMGVLDANEDT